MNDSKSENSHYLISFFVSLLLKVMDFSVQIEYKSLLGTIEISNKETPFAADLILNRMLPEELQPVKFPVSEEIP